MNRLLCVVVVEMIVLAIKITGLLLLLSSALVRKSL